MADGIRTRDRRDHNAELYQLSYSHLAGSQFTGPPDLAGGGRSPASGAVGDDHARPVAGDHRHVAVEGALGLGLGGFEVEAAGHRL